MDPGIAIGASQHPVGFLVTNDLSGFGIPGEGAAQLHRQIGQNASRRRYVALLDIGDRSPA